MNVPTDLLYAKTHEWVSRESDDPSLVTVGVSDHAQAELTDIVYVELPSIDAEVEAGGPAAVVESVKAASDIYAPLSGSVVEVNEALVDDPSLINTDPFGEGWLFTMRLSDPNEVTALLSPEASSAQISS